MILICSISQYLETVKSLLSVPQQNRCHHKAAQSFPAVSRQRNAVPAAVCHVLPLGFVHSSSPVCHAGHPSAFAEPASFPPGDRVHVASATFSICTPAHKKLPHPEDTHGNSNFCESRHHLLLYLLCIPPGAAAQTLRNIIQILDSVRSKLNALHHHPK